MQALKENRQRNAFILEFGRIILYPMNSIEWSLINNHRLSNLDQLLRPKKVVPTWKTSWAILSTHYYTVFENYTKRRDLRTTRTMLETLFLRTFKQYSIFKKTGFYSSKKRCGFHKVLQTSRFEKAWSFKDARARPKEQPWKPISAIIVVAMCVVPSSVQKKKCTAIKL